MHRGVRDSVPQWRERRHRAQPSGAEATLNEEVTMSNSLTMPFSAAIIAAVMFSSCLTTSSARADAAYLIKNLKSGRCLDARDPDPSVNNPLPNGTAIQLWDCWGGPMQQWTFPADGSIRNVKGGRCLDARDPDPHGSNPLPDGTAIQLWDCWGGPMQQWAGILTANLRL